MNTDSTVRSLLLSLTAALAIGGCDQGSDDEQFDGHDFRIVGGAPVNTDPAVALLGMYDANGNLASTCTGTLIDAQWILTAAHCLSPAGIAGVGVYFGADATVMSDPSFVAYVEADQAAIHPQWVDGGAPDQGNDVALLHLSQAAPVEPIAINRTALTQEMLGADVYLVGWGITGGGQQDSMIKRAVMSSLYDFDSSFMVVGDTNTGTCSGDSGGPAFMMMNNQMVVAGVTSYGDTNCEQISVDMRVDAFVPWIDQTMGVAPPTNPTNPPTGGGAGGIGEQCESGNDCQTGLCVGDGTSGFCTAQCSSDADCGEGWACFGTDDPSLSVCAPDQGGGEGGEGGEGGDTPMFPMPGGNPTIPGGDEDGEQGTDEGGGGGGGGYDDDDDDSKGGCSVGSKAPSSLALMMVVLGGLVRRRRS
jgi:MYXO-CTERM domain-containing protein